MSKLFAFLIGKRRNVDVEESKSTVARVWGEPFAPRSWRACTCGHKIVHLAATVSHPTVAVIAALHVRVRLPPHVLRDAPTP